MCSREIDGKVTTLGTTGYTHNNIFLLYDRESESVWYPLDDGGFDAIAGSKRGSALAFLAKPPVTTLGEWLTLHPDSLVLLGESSHRDRTRSGRVPPFRQ